MSYDKDVLQYYLYIDTIVVRRLYTYIMDMNVIAI